MAFSDIWTSLEETGLAQYIREGLYPFPLIEVVHVIALALVFGTIFIVDLRILGVASVERAVRAVERDVLKWTWGGFVVAVVTGLLMFISNASNYVANLPFQIKMGLLLAAGLNLLIFELGARRKLDQWDLLPRAPQAARIAALLSIVIWTSVIFAGRWIGFTISQTANEAVEAEAPPPEMDFDDFLSGQ